MHLNTPRLSFEEKTREIAIVRIRMKIGCNFKLNWPFCLKSDSFFIINNFLGQSNFCNRHLTGVYIRTLKSLAPSTHWEFSISILKFNVKMAPEISGFFHTLPLSDIIFITQFDTLMQKFWFTKVCSRWFPDWQPCDHWLVSKKLLLQWVFTRWRLLSESL